MRVSFILLKGYTLDLPLTAARAFTLQRMAFFMSLTLLVQLMFSKTVVKPLSWSA